MNIVLTQAVMRTGKPGKTRRDGFIPGVIYGDGLENSIAIQFELKKLKRVLKRSVRNSKIHVELGEAIRYCVIKEIQKHPVTGEMLHIDLQTVNENNIIRMKLPIVFSGKNKLDEKKHQLHIFLSRISVAGAAGIMPGYITVDLKDKIPGDKITVKDIELIDGLRIMEGRDEVIAAITVTKDLEIAS